MRPRPIWLLCLLIAACKSTDKQAPQAPTPSEQPLQSATYSTSFGAGLDSLIQAYSALSFSLNKNDTTGGVPFLAKLDALPLDEFKKDTLIYKTAVQQIGDTRTELLGLLGEKTLEGKRQELNMVSQDMYDLLRTLHYTQKMLYVVECSSAFGEDKPGVWISLTSDTNALQNPYGTGHCGQIKDSLPGHP